MKLSLVLAIMSGYCYASQPNDLRQIPATKYDIAEIKLQLAAAMFDVDYHGDELNEKNLEVIYASPRITNKHFVLVVNLRAKSRHLTDKKCQQIKQSLSDDFYDLEAENAWYFNSVSDDEFEPMFIYGVRIVDEDNYRHVVSC